MPSTKLHAWVWLWLPCATGELCMAGSAVPLLNPVVWARVAIAASFMTSFSIGGGSYASEGGDGTSCCSLTG